MKKIQKLLCIAMTLILALSCLCAYAEEDGWLSITVGDEKTPFERNGMTFEIFLIATGNYGDWTMLDAFSDINVFTREDGSASVDVTLAQIDRRIEGRNIKPTGKEKTGKDGKVEFKKLKRGIYFVRMTDGPERVTVSPMLLSTPNKEGTVQIRAVAKFTYETPTPSPTPTPKPTLTPFVTPTPTPGPSSTPTPTTAEPTRTPVATPTPTPNPETTPIPKHVPQLSPKPGETVIEIDEYETALGLGNIQMHVGVCFE